MALKEEAEIPRIVGVLTCIAWIALTLGLAGILASAMGSLHIDGPLYLIGAGLATVATAKAIELLARIEFNTRR